MSLTGHLLVAMPQMLDQRFARSVVYISANGAVGSRPVHFGGPVEGGRGFVLHSADYNEEATLLVDDNIALTATLDVLRAIGQGQGPRRNLFALGYAGWAPGQLDAEIQANGWLSVPADDAIVFGSDHDRKWERALAKLGIDLTMLSSEAGHA